MRVLFLTHRLPYAPNRGDRVRAYHILRFLAQYAEIDLLSLVHDAHEAKRAAEVERFGVNVHTARVSQVSSSANAVAAMLAGRPLTHALLDAPSIGRELARLAARGPDVVLAYCSGMARFALESPLDGCPFVLDMVDVDSAKWAFFSRTAAIHRRAIYAREAERLALFEVKAVRRAAATVVVNEREASIIRQLVADAEPLIIPNGVDVAEFEPKEPPADGADVVFTGVFNYQPNEEGAIWLARHVWPLVLAARPDARLRLVGSSPSRAVRALTRVHDSIEVTGAVPDVRPYLWRSAVGVAPLDLARGIQNKVLEAVAAGLPCVVTPSVLEGIPAQARRACTVAITPDAFASAIVALLNLSPAGRRNLASLASMSDLQWNVQLWPLLDVLSKTAFTSPERRVPDWAVADGGVAVDGGANRLPSTTL
jgi:sugar transferase (PEP-CTERM/EpsH1 system associated)